MPTLPKFDLRDAELAPAPDRRPRLGDRAAGCARRSTSTAGGVDVANMAGRNRDIDVNHAVAVAMRRTMAEAKPDAYLVAEHCYDASRDLDGDGWHGVMNYLAFTRPVWALAARRRRRGAQVPRRPAAAPPLRRRAPRSASIVEVAAPRSRGGRRVVRLQPARVTRHDAVPHACAAAPNATSPAPGCCSRCPACRWCSPATRSASPASRATAPASRCRGTTSDWDRAVLDAYRSLGALRRASPALRRGGLRWVHAGDDVLVYLRESRDERLLVQVGRARPRAGARSMPPPSTAPSGERRFGDGDVIRDARRRSCCPAAGAAVHVWELN